MTAELDRYAIQRAVNQYRNDLLSAFHSPGGAPADVKRNAIARAKSFLTDLEYLSKIAESLRQEIVEAQRKG